MVEKSNRFGSNSPSRQQPMGAGIQENDPYKGDEENYQNDFRKTFITENQHDKDEESWTLHDMMIPGG